MNTGVIVYIPPIGFKDTRFFVENLQKYPPSGELIIVSDHDYKSAFPKAIHICLTTSPEHFAGNKNNPHSGISNAVFVVCMRTARQLGLSHVLYLESDCRVIGQDWDRIVFNEFFSHPFPLIAGGTIMAWNIFNGGQAWIKPWRDMVINTKSFPVPPHLYGVFPNGASPCNPTIFANGAASVLSVDWMWDLFGGFGNMMNIATGKDMEGKAYDWQIGELTRKKFGPAVFQLFLHMKSVCSCYGDLAITKEQRLELLRTNRVVVAHQFKGKEEA